MWIVYKESEHGEHKAIEVSGYYTADQISETVGHVNPPHYPGAECLVNSLLGFGS